MHANAADHYMNIFFSERAALLMRREGIIAPTGSPISLLTDLVGRLASAEKAIGEDVQSTDAELANFYDYVRRGLCTLGTPLLTNVSAGHQTLGSCTAVPLDMSLLQEPDFDLAEAYYNLNMGSGYNLNSSPDPRSTLVALNKHAAEVEGSGSCERYVGNIAHVSAHHPRVLDFVTAKDGRDDIVHFNISVDVTDEFMNAVRDDGMFLTSDGTVVAAAPIWKSVVESAWRSGDPGIISLQRYNAWNAMRSSRPYVTTAPCAEVGLSAGESCVFGYINIAACIRPGPSPHVDLDLIGEVAECLVRILDDAVESSLGGYPTAVSSSVMATNRKVGIGVCGFADALLWLGIDYASSESVKLLANILATINYRSKEASLRLAERRGPFPGFFTSELRRGRAFIARFADVETTVDRHAWFMLAEEIAKRGVRNVMTTALPPSGRSALLLGANPSIEPYLTLQDDVGPVAPLRALTLTGRARIDDSSGRVVPYLTERAWATEASTPTSIFRTAAEIPPHDHLKLLGVAGRLVDDGVSKTINLPVDAAVADVDAIFMEAWRMGLKAISVYRIGSRGPSV